MKVCLNFSFQYLKIKFRIKKYKNINILILGYSFKSNTGDTRFTPVEKFINLIRKRKNLLINYL